MTQNAADELKFGQLLSTPEDGNEVVISGISGCFPDSYNVAHFRDNLFNKVDLVVDDTRRWKLDHPEIPKRHGKIYDIEKYDASYFGIQYDEANNMDPLIRIFMERAIEAIIDAGLNPKDLEGSNTGVFVGACYSDTESNRFRNVGMGFSDMSGSTRSMIPNRVSYHLKLKGPSMVADTACSSSLFALEQAYRAIRTGQVENAIVGGVNLCIHPLVSLQFARLGVLSLDGSCKAFDESGNGYARSEAFGALLLQKSKNTKRIYCQILHAKTNCDGFKDQGITYPSGEAQRMLLRDFYNECKIDPTTLSFLEAHGTGTKVGDPEELNAISDIFCTNEDKSILIGSVKSNIGHTEPVSGVCSIIKAIIGMESGFIPPNLHYSTPRKGVKALEDGKLEVVVDKTPFRDERGLIGINSFGFGGGNCHVLLKWNEKRKINNGHPQDDLPRLVCVSGRTQETVNNILNDVKQFFDVEHVKLLHSLFRQNHESNLVRGYSIVSKSGEICRSVEPFFETSKPFYFIFGSYDQYWQNLGRNLYVLPTFVESIQRIHNLLVKKGINLKEILFDDKLDNQILNYLGYISVQLAIVDLLKTLNLTPDKVFGYSLGEIICGYYDGVLTLAEALHCAYVILKNIKIVNKTTYSYLVRQTAQELRFTLPENIQLIELTTEYNVIESKDMKKIEDFVNQLLENDVEVKNLTEMSNFDFEYTSTMKNGIIKSLLGIESRNWTNKRILPHNAKQLNLPEHFVIYLKPQIESIKSLLAHLNGNEVILQTNTDEFTAILEAQSVNIYNLSKSVNDLLITFLERLGQLYLNGFNPLLEKLYPEVEFPVSRGTPMISSSIRWKHDLDWEVVYYDTHVNDVGETRTSLASEDTDWAFVAGHIIDGRNLFPATGYLSLVWDSITSMAGILMTSLTVVFENCRFIRATTVPKRDKLNLISMIQKETGNFEVIEGDSVVCSGRVYLINDADETVDWVKLSDDYHKQEIKLKTKDIYKELRLRGYHYKGAFKKIIECNIEANEGLIEWNDDFISFMDNMLQMKILQLDSRLLYVPTSIDKVIVKSRKHVEYLGTFDTRTPLLPVLVSKEMDMISCGTVEIHGLKASSIAKRKEMAEPVLEKNEFIPNETNLTIDESIRVNVQLILENLHTIKVKAVELDNTEDINEDTKLLSPILVNVLGDMPLMQPDVTLLTKRENLELQNITIRNETSISKAECVLLITRDLLTNKKNLQQAFENITDNGYILTRESIQCNVNQLKQLKYNSIDLNVLTIHNVGDEIFVLISKQPPNPTNRTVINISNTDTNFNWLSNLKAALKTNDSVIVYSQNEPLNGISGLVNCIRREPDGLKLRCVFIMDKNAPEFNVNNEFYNVQLKKNLSMNVFKNGTWGTYRHILLSDNQLIDSEYTFVKNTVRGDLSSLKWLESPLTQYNKDITNFVKVYYSAINFRDVMIASGRINEDVACIDRTDQDCAIGFEFSGYDESGNRIMGLSRNSAICSSINGNSVGCTFWKVPDWWTLEQAATVPVVYATVIYAFVIKARIKKNDTVLIHSGTGGIGLAAIQIALHYGCTVYTTVGTKEKREFLKNYFPQLTDDHIGNSHDLSFEQFIYSRTNGRGADIVLNSLSEEKLLASVRCLAHGGRFLEIGKYDFANNNLLQLLLLNKDATFFGIVLDDSQFNLTFQGRSLYRIIRDHIKEGAVKPLPTTKFGKDEVEKAFRYMTTGKHIGKVLIEVRRENIDNDLNVFKTYPRYYCNADKVYVIIGGLGGFGLELADWLILRGARKVVLTSRQGIKTGYQAYRIKIWNSYGTQVHISTANVTTEEGCQQLLYESMKLGEIQSIFNLAVVLKDAIFQNQTTINFQTSFEPKAIATQHLDKLTRKLCPNLKDFVVFSSVSCGRGNAGQSNYGMSNSVMERICEERRRDGLPALAIQWGAIGQVGLVAEMNEEAIEMNIGGTLQQSITSCTNVLDIFLKQTQTAIVSSIVVAEKGASGSADSPVQAVANILGIKDLKSVSLHASLAELGMDSMNAVEIKQTLEREFEIFLTPTDIRTMTFAKLFELQNREENSENNKPFTAVDTFKTLIRYLLSEDTHNFPEVQLKSITNNSSTKVLFFPGVESVANTLAPLANKFSSPSVGFQYGFSDNNHDIGALAKDLSPFVVKHVKKSTPFSIVAYSYGVLIAIEIASILESLNYYGKIICIDGAPELLKKLIGIVSDTDSDDLLQTGMVCHLMALYEYRQDIIEKYKEQLMKCSSLTERLRVVDIIMEETKEQNPEKVQPKHVKEFITQVYYRLKSIMNYTPKIKKLKSKLILVKANHSSPDCSDDYQLSEFSEQTVDVYGFNENHVTILDNEQVLQLINELTAVQQQQQQQQPLDKLKIFEKNNINGVIVEEEKTI